MRHLHFHRDYLEEVTLQDGTKTLFRCVRPEDKQLLVDGLQQLSEESRYRRFFTAKPSLSDQELVFLTEVDGHDHFALGATVEQGGQRVGIGIGRFIRLSDRTDVAEPAVVVVDEEQGKGLGHMLFLRLVSAARERGINRFRCEILSNNKAVKRLLEEVPTYHEVEHKGLEEIIEFDLPELDPYADDYGEPPRVNPFKRIAKALRAGEIRMRNSILQMYQNGYEPRDILLKKKR